MGPLLGNIVNKVGKYIKDAEERVYGVDAPDAEVTVDGNKIIVKGAPEAEMEDLKAGIFEEEPDFGINLGRAGDQLDLIDPNYDVTKLLQTLKANNEELFQRARRGSIPMEELIKLSQSVGADAIAAKFLKREPGELFPAEDIVGGLLLVKKLALDIGEGLRGIDDLEGAAKDEMRKKILFLTSMEKNILANVSGNVSEMGRGLAAVSNMEKLSQIDVRQELARVEQLEQNMEKGLFKFARAAYLQLPGHAKASFRRDGFMQRSWDLAMETYINALVSAPPTHLVNIAGNAIFQGTTLAERGVAGAIGAVRTIGGRRGKPGDRVYMGEVAAESHGLIMSQMEALALSAKTFVEGESPDLMSKIDLFAGTDKRRAIGSTDNLKQIYDMAAQGDYSGFALNLMGVSNRLPGRFLATEDEYFKVITRRRVLHREAYVKSVQAFEAARMEGMSREDAKDFAAIEYANIIADPPKDIAQLMRDEAKKMTFQNVPEGMFGTGVAAEAAANAQPILQWGPMRTILPFYRTPQNIINATLDRTFNIYPTYKAIKEGSGRDFDMAVSKLAVGHSIFWTFAALANGYFGDDVIVTGSGPTDPRIEKLRKAANVPQYSIGFKKDDGSYDFVSYSRFDPISGVLAMAADYASYAKNAPDNQSAIEAMSNLASHGSLAAAEYATNMPYLQGIGEIMRAVQSPYQSTEGKVERIGKFLGKKAGDVAMTIGGTLEPRVAPLRYFGAEFPTLGSTPFQAAIERYTDPTARSKVLEEGEYFDPFSVSSKGAQDLPTFMQGFYSSYTYHKSRSPAQSKELEPELSFWGEELTQGTGAVGEIFSPIQIKEGFYSDLNLELERLSDTGAGAFAHHPRKIQANNSGNFDLNSKQYNQFIKMINEVDENGNLPGDEFYDPGTNLMSSLNDMMASPAYSDAFDDNERYGMMSGIVSKRRLEAKRRLIASDPTLNALMGE